MILDRNGMQNVFENYEEPQELKFFVSQLAKWLQNWF